MSKPANTESEEAMKPTSHACDVCGGSGRERLVSEAKAAGLSVDTEGGPLCHVCAAGMVADSEYVWLGLTRADCYNCDGRNL